MKSATKGLNNGLYLFLVRLRDPGQIKEVKRTTIHTVMATFSLTVVLHCVGQSLPGKMYNVFAVFFFVPFFFLCLFWPFFYA